LGLTFVPNPTLIPFIHLHRDLAYITRSLQLKDFFDGKPSSGPPSPFDLKFKPISHWRPPSNSIRSETKQTISDIVTTFRRITDPLKVYKNYRPLEPRPTSSLFIKHKNPHPNLPPPLKQALHTLKMDQRIQIKPADKGGAVVILDKQLYIDEAMRQLTNTKYYKPLTSPIYHQTSKLIDTILFDLRTRGFLTTKNLQYLRPMEVRQRHFYLLPKIHKDPSTWTHPRMPPGRPIVSACSSELHPISQYIDWFLKPLSQTHPAYLKDTYDFVDKVRDFEIGEHDLLVTGDITSLYTNMDHQEILQVTREYFELFPNPNRPDESLLELLRLTLTRNDFEFNGRVFLQILGMSMGATHAPSSADMYLARLDQAARQGWLIHPSLYARFLDDVFMTWKGSRQQLLEFQSFLNTRLKNITISLKANDSIIEFLDVHVYKTILPDGRWVLKTKVYFKPTDTHQLLHKTSNHPRHTTLGILKAQFIRFKRISSYKSDYDQASHTLMDVLKTRGYPLRLMRSVKRNIWHNYDTSLKRKPTHKPTFGPTNKPQLLPVITYFDRISHHLNHSWRQIIGKNPHFKLPKFRSISSLKKHKNLRHHLVRTIIKPTV
jgi:hypothetical protein